MNTQKEILSKEKLEAKVEILGHQLTEKCHEYGGGIVFICVMNGSFMFYSDLVKHIKYPIETSFLKCQSYDGLEQKKKLTLDYIPSTDFKDKTIFIVDDILDSGNTMNYLKSYLHLKGAKQIETVSVVYKENLDFPNHFYIYKQPKGVNPWYIGYGMDGPKGYSRNLDTIHTL
jgi:hypoxanthine phosphoribosyltransferase|tara:strand:- start:137 stop:655 length:519 start_codon:yes stop_codon:yes gene_type:complete